MAFTLRNKAIVAFAIAAIYIGLVTTYVIQGSVKRLELVKRIEQIQAVQHLVLITLGDLGDSVSGINALLNDAATPGLYVSELDRARVALTHVGLLDPSYRQAFEQETRKLEQSIAAAGVVQNEFLLAAVRDHELTLGAKFGDLASLISRSVSELYQAYESANRRGLVISQGLYVAGYLVFGTVAMLFMTHMVRDLKRLQDRAMAVVSGYRAEPLKVRRQDEVGGLMRAVNRMQALLQAWESEQELSRQQRFHHEKMAAVGSLAAAIGHEVSNPIAAIAGVAEEILEHSAPPPGQKIERRSDNPAIHAQAEMILSHAERIAMIIRRLSFLTDAGSPSPELLDLNGLIRANCSFLGFDKRFRELRFELELDPGIPALYAVPDHLIQVLMNLMINAADAMENRPADKPSVIVVRSAVVDGQVEVSVTDHGSGIKSEQIELVFNERFTTKPVGKGRGIGLYLCKSLIESAGGTITLESVLGEGATARIRLPIVDPDKA